MDQERAQSCCPHCSLHKPKTRSVCGLSQDQLNFRDGYFTDMFRSNVFVSSRSSAAKRRNTDSSLFHSNATTEDYRDPGSRGPNDMERDQLPTSGAFSSAAAVRGNQQTEANTWHRLLLRGGEGKAASYRRPNTCRHFFFLTCSLLCLCLCSRH